MVKNKHNLKKLNDYQREFTWQTIESFHVWSKTLVESNLTSCSSQMIKITIEYLIILRPKQN